MPPFIGRKRHESSSPPAPPARKRQKNETPAKKTSTTRATPKSTRNSAQKPKPTVFDHVDSAKASSSSSAKPVNGRIFTGVQDSDDESDSDEDSDEFEDVVHPQPAAADESAEDDDDEHWEDALHDDDDQASQQAASTDEAEAPSGPIEITLNQREPEMSFAEFSGKKQGPSKKEKKVREAAHRIHVQFLMWHNYLRNHWLNDEEIQAIMVSHVEQAQQMKVQIESWRRRSGMQPLKSSTPAKQSAKAKETIKQKGKGKGKGKERQVEDSDDLRNKRDWIDPAERQAVGQPDLSRGDPVIALLNALAAWWRKRFTITAPGLRKRGYKPMRLIKEQLQAWKKGESAITDHGERIANLKEFKSCAKRCEGSRDVGVQLFVALLRGLGIEARMVTSLQPLGFGWTKHEEAEKKDTQAIKNGSTVPQKVKATPTARGRGRPKGTGKTKAAPIKLSDTSELSDLDSDDSDASIVDITPKKRPNMAYDNDLVFPTYWIEAISSVTNRVFPVDPFVLKPSVATSAEHMALFEARGAKAEKARQIFAYIVAFSPDRSAKDVTTRYLKKHIWPGKTKGFRIPPTKVSIQDRRGRIIASYDVDWWRIIMQSYTRPQNKRTKVDEIEEEAELRAVQPEKKLPKMGDPDTLDGYKRSDKFVLERHLRRDEALKAGARQVKTFSVGKGENAKEEPVYLRKDVALCRTSESWHKEGRQIKFGEQPLKMVAVRAVTINRKREIQEVERQSGEKATQGMYSEDQTEWIIPPPIQNGVIPKNAFGNMDAFVPQMIPKGAVHIPMRGTKRVCNKLEIDFAEAVTGFEFGHRMAVPVIQGVVVAEENRDLVIDAWNKAEEDRKAREAAKREKEILATWRKFLMGLRVLERMRAEYEVNMDDDVQERNPFMNRKKPSAMQEKPTAQGIAPGSIDANDHETGGGFSLAEEPDIGGGFFPEGHSAELPAHPAKKPKASSQEQHLEIEHEDEDEEQKNSALSKGRAMSLAQLAAQQVKSEHDEDDQMSDNASFSAPETAAASTSKSVRAHKGSKNSTTSASATAKKPKTTPRAKRGRKPKKMESPNPPAEESDLDVANSSSAPLSDHHETPPPPAPSSARSIRASARSAAKASQQRIRSHYFKHESTGDADDDNDDDE